MGGMCRIVARQSNAIACPFPRYVRIVRTAQQYGLRDTRETHAPFRTPGYAIFGPPGGAGEGGSAAGSTGILPRSGPGRAPLRSSQDGDTTRCIDRDTLLVHGV